MDIQLKTGKLTNLKKYNIIIGKNGSGKSRILREIDINNETWNILKYISPERAGTLDFEASIEQNIIGNPGYLEASRVKNQDAQFRQKSFFLLKNLETLINRKRSNESRDGLELTPHFDETLKLINKLLDNILLSFSEQLTPNILGRVDDLLRSDSQLSSGEKELISLSTEILHFCFSVKNSNEKTKKSILLLDEPDVHLHPDLQVRLMTLLLEVTKELSVIIIISTHSTAILGALSKSDTSVVFMNKGQTSLDFIPIDKELEQILPVFGSHPLSNIFNENPIMLVEGDDDERIWDQVCKSTQGKIKLWPCPVKSIKELNKYEKKLSNIIDSIYDKPKAYSLRDRDDKPYPIDDIGYVIRFKLNCYSAENLFLTNDVLQVFKMDWNSFKGSILEWIRNKSDHPKIEIMKKFSEKFDRRNFKVKELMTIFLYLVDSNKPWTSIVGQSIAGLNSESSSTENSLKDYLGSKLLNNLFPTK